MDEGRAALKKGDYPAAVAKFTAVDVLPPPPLSPGTEMTIMPTGPFLP